MIKLLVSDVYYEKLPLVLLESAGEIKKQNLRKKAGKVQFSQKRRIFM